LLRSEGGANLKLAGKGWKTSEGASGLSSAVDEHGICGVGVGGDARDSPTDITLGCPSSYKYMSAEKTSTNMERRIALD
jgi:hypothetical protein